LYELRHELVLPLKILFETSYKLVQLPADWKIGNVTAIFTARNARIASAVLATAIPSVCMSVCPSVTRQYCVKTTARSMVQFAPLHSKMCLVLEKPKNIPQGRPLPPEILAQSDLPTPEGCEL